MAREPLRVLTEPMFYVLLSLLRQEQIPMRKVYRQNGDGTLEEIGL